MAIELLDLHSDVLREILILLDGRSLLACIEASSILEEEIRRIRGIWSLRCSQEMDPLFHFYCSMKNDVNRNGLSEDRWFKIYYFWVNPKLRFKETPRIISCASAFAWDVATCGSTIVVIENRQTCSELITVVNGYVEFFDVSNHINNYVKLYNEELLPLNSQCPILVDPCGPYEYLPYNIRKRPSSDNLFNIIPPCYLQTCKKLRKSFETLPESRTGRWRNFAVPCIRNNFSTFKCNITCCLIYGSLVLVGSDIGHLFVSTIDDVVTGNDEGGNFNPKFTDIHLRVKTDCKPILTIDVVESENEFVIAVISASRVSRIAFPVPNV